MGRDIHIDLGDKERPRKLRNWKSKLSLYCFLLIIGFALGSFYDVRILKRTFLDKQRYKDKLLSEIVQLEKEIDSIKDQLDVKRSDQHKSR